MLFLFLKNTYLKKYIAQKYLIVGYVRVQKLFFEENQFKHFFKPLFTFKGTYVFIYISVVYRNFFYGTCFKYSENCQK